MTSNYFQIGFEKAAKGLVEDKGRPYAVAHDGTPISKHSWGLMFHTKSDGNIPYDGENNEAWDTYPDLRKFHPRPKDVNVIAGNGFGDPLYEHKGHIYQGSHEASKGAFHKDVARHVGTLIGTKTKPFTDKKKAL